MPMNPQPSVPPSPKRKFSLWSNLHVKIWDVMPIGMATIEKPEDDKH